MFLSLPPPTRNNYNTKINTNTCERVYDHVNGKVDLIVNINSFSGTSSSNSKFFNDDVHLSNAGIRLLVSKIKSVVCPPPHKHFSTHIYL